MGCKIRWDIPTNHPKNCRCTPCLSVNVFDKKPPMTAMIREALPSHEWEKIIFQTSANAVGRQVKTMTKAFREFGETVHKAADTIQKNVQAVEASRKNKSKPRDPRVHANVRVR